MSGTRFPKMWERRNGRGVLRLSGLTMAVLRWRGKPSGGRVAPSGSGLAGLQLVEDMVPDDVHLDQPPGPAGPHVFGVVMRRAADVGEVGLAVHDLVGDALGGAPGVGLVDAQRLALAGEGELAGLVVRAVLVDDAANAGGIEATGRTIEHDLGDSRLSLLRLAARFEIHRLSEGLALMRAALAARSEERRVGKECRSR